MCKASLEHDDADGLPVPLPTGCTQLDDVAHTHSTLAKFSHCQLQWRICRRLFTHTVTSAKCIVMPKMGGEAVSHQTFRLHVQAG